MSAVKVSLGGVLKRSSSSRKMSAKSAKLGSNHSDPSLIHSTNQLLYSHGVTQIAGNKDQDRFHTATNSEHSLASDFFGVFDGHGTSSLAADICVADLFKNICGKSSSGDNAKSMSKFVNEEEIVQGFLQTDDKIRQRAKELNELRTGTCAVCLFIEPLTNFQHLFDHSAHTSQTVQSKVSKQSSLSEENFNVSFDDESEEVLTLNEDNLEIKLRAKFAWVGDSRAILLNSSGDILISTEDHKVETNQKERDRIAEHTKNSKPRDGILESDFWKNELANHNKFSEKQKQMNPLRAKSFIGKRQLPNGVAVGGQVLFAYSNGISLQVSRSLGDPLAARSAIPVPEIENFELLFSKSMGKGGYRIVLASDGVWDVLSNKQVSKLLYKVKDPKVASEVVAKQAHFRRVSEGMTIDDITCVVVDIPDILQLLGSRDEGSKGLLRYRRSFLNLMKLSTVTSTLHSSMTGSHHE